VTKKIIGRSQSESRSKMKLWCNSKSAISISNNPMQHVKIDRFFIKEKLESGLLELSQVATGNQVGNYLTKGLSSINLVRLCNKMDLMDIFCPS
jgi:hypothetical protein